MFKSKTNATEKSFTQTPDLKDLVNGEVQEVFFKESSNEFWVRGFHTSNLINPDATINQEEKDDILRSFSSSKHLSKVERFIAHHEQAAQQWQKQSLQGTSK